MHEGVPAVAVIVPVLNGERFLDEALASIYAQTLPPTEVIVVDDGSTDATAEIAVAWPSVRYVWQENQGVSAARNHGLALASSPLVAFLDVDDLWLPQKLALQSARLVAQPELGFVLCHMRAELVDRDEWPTHLNVAHYQTNPPLFTPSALLAWRDTFLRVGDFDIALRVSEDSDWFLRARDAGVEREIVPEVLVIRRFHTQNASYQVAATSEALFGALRNSVQRQRQLRNSAQKG